MTSRIIVPILLACCLGAPGISLAATANSAETEDAIKVAPIMLDGEVLFRVRGISALPATERAAMIREKILVVARDSAIDPGSGELQAQPDRTTVVFGTSKIASFYPPDAEIEDVPLELVAEAALNRIKFAITQYRSARSPEQLMQKTAILVAISIAAGVLFWAILVLFNWLDHLLERRVQRKIKKLEQASHRVLDARQIGGWLRGLLQGSRFLSLLALIVIWLESALGLYPWTQRLAEQIFLLVLDPIKEMGLGLLAALPDLVFLAVLFVVIRFALRAVRTFFERVHRGWIRLASFDAELAMPTYRIVRVFIIVFGLVIAYPYIPGSNSEAFKALSIFFGVVLSIGSSSFIANIIAGYSLTYRRAFREGDRIKVGEQEGIVVEMRTLNTRVRSMKNEEINIPNSLVLASPIINYSTFQREPGLILHTEVGIGYDVPWRQVEAMLIQAAGRTEGLRQDPTPFVLQKSLGDFTVVYQLNAYCEAAEKMNSLYSELHSHIQDVFNEFGVQIMSPNYVADPQLPKVVAPDQLYCAPAERPAT